MSRDVELVLLEQLSSCLAIPMFVVDPEGNLLFFNESAEPLVGQRFEESGTLSLDEWDQAIQPADETGRRLDDAERPLVAALRRREPVHGRLSIRNPGGEPRVVETTAIPLVREDGKMLGALGLFWQPGAGERTRLAPALPGRPRTQCALEAILMQRLASHLSTPIYLTGAEGQLLYFNKAAERILGRTLDEMLASSRKEAYEIFHPTTLDGAPLDFQSHPLTIARLCGEPAHLRFRHSTDGVSYQIEGTAFPLIDQSGRILGAAGIFWETQES